MFLKLTSWGWRSRNAEQENKPAITVGENEEKKWRLNSCWFWILKDHINPNEELFPIHSGMTEPLKIMGLLTYNKDWFRVLLFLTNLGFVLGTFSSIVVQDHLFIFFHRGSKPQLTRIIYRNLWNQNETSKQCSGMPWLFRKIYCPVIIWQHLFCSREDAQDIRKLSVCQKKARRRSVEWVKSRPESRVTKLN